MRTALIAALKRTDSGALRASLPLAGRSVLERQADLLLRLGCTRVLCLCEAADGAVLRAQQSVEAAGGTFQALRGFLHLPALVRAEDELVILADGLLPDPALVASLLGEGRAVQRLVASLPADDPVVVRHPEDFERIDAQHHWAGLLAMRGAPVQQLADFPPDADAISLLLRLALQSGTTVHALPQAAAAQGAWLLASDEAALVQQEQALILRAAGGAEWRNPSASLASLAAQALAPKGLANGPVLAALGAAVLGLGGIAAAAAGWSASGLALAGIGALATALAGTLGAMRQELLGTPAAPGQRARLGQAGDLVAASTLLLALSSGLAIVPLAALGPLLIGLARLTGRAAVPAPFTFLSDRAVLLGLLTLAAGLSHLASATAVLALVLMAGLLLPPGKNRG